MPKVIKKEVTRSSLSPRLSPPPVLPTTQALKGAFTDAKFMFSFTVTPRDPLSWATPFVYWPRDEYTGHAVRVCDLLDYSKTHDWMKNFYCFCGAKDLKNRRIKVFIPKEGGSFGGEVVLACNNWMAGGLAGCNFYFKAEYLFNRDPLQHTEEYPVKRGPRAPRAQAPYLLPPPFEPLPLLPFPSSPTLRSDSDNGTPPRLAYPKAAPNTIVPGLVTSAERLWSPPPSSLAFQFVEDTPPPSKEECDEAVMRLTCQVFGGISWHDFMRGPFWVYSSWHASHIPAAIFGLLFFESVVFEFRSTPHFQLAEQHFQWGCDVTSHFNL
ncbi:hypothetical protein EUX98_g9650 [Antrodiella citrinella]|uniref:Uncharacterized protein n=1 Tax=Antrodiella citrinella TaxID=2447956 RepID=A0A4S4LV03_9APHY|nr:hypothetical protein EUX98_g9650 [Antrodiella citrinella]